MLYFYRMGRKHLSQVQKTEQEILQEFLEGFPHFNQEQKQGLAAELRVLSVPKGQLLIREGDRHTDCYFVLQGALRQYRLQNDQEISIRFYFEGDAAVLLSSYRGKEASDGFLTCLEDSLVIAGNMDTEAEFYSRYPDLKEVTDVMLQDDFARTQSDFSRFISFSPEERYLHLLEHQPRLFQRVPQHQIASYIGITPESLSRLRKRLHRK